MRINKFVKKKNGMYKVVFSDFEIEVHEDLILKYDLLVKRDLTEEMVLELEKENLKYKVYDMALKELKKRLRSSKELKDILLKKGYASLLIDEVILMLIKQGYLNDSIYIESYIHDQILFSSYGPLKIKQNLISKGIASDDIDSKIKVFTRDLEVERIKKIINKYLQRNRKSLTSFKIYMKQTLNRFGYHMELVDLLVNEIRFNDDSLYEKEYDKIYRRLSKKYSGKELEYKIKQKMYQKGFSKNFD